MNELDLKLSALRQATENVAPSSQAMEAIHGAVDQLVLTPGPTSNVQPGPGVPGAATGLGGAKLTWLIASIVFATLVGGGLFAWIQSRAGSRGDPGRYQEQNRPAEAMIPIGRAAPAEMIPSAPAQPAAALPAPVVAAPVGCEPEMKGSAPAPDSPAAVPRSGALGPKVHVKPAWPARGERDSGAAPHPGR